MFLFYSSDIEGPIARFEEEEARHMAQVLRKKPGEYVHFVDGVGGRYKGQLEEVHKKTCLARIVEADQEAEPDFHLHMAVAPTKNISRFEWFVEKATEIGVHEITPIRTAHSERTKVRIDRLERIAMAAMKQSLKCRLPIIHPMDSMATVLEARSGMDQQFIAWCGEDGLSHLKHNYRPGHDVMLWIGPEGDFSLPEIELARQFGCTAVSLGPSRLRTETAALAACHIINLMNNG